MLVFNNQQRSGYEEIAAYSPRYYGRIREMDAVFRLAGWLTDLMARDMENMVAFQFMAYMDDKSLSRYEAFLGIAKDQGKTLEERKSYINALLIGSGKMSADKITALVNQFGGCACENIVLDGSVLHIEVVISKELDQNIRNSIHDLLAQKLPTHIFMDITFDNAMFAKMYVGGVMYGADIIELKQR